MVQHDLCVGAQETTARQQGAEKAGKWEAECVSLHVATNRHQQHLVRKKSWPRQHQHRAAAAAAGLQHCAVVSVRATRGNTMLTTALVAIFHIVTVSASAGY